MKKLFLLCFVIVITIFFSSCDNETIDTPNDNGEDLVSIVEEFVQSGSSATYSINDDLNTVVEWSYGTIQNNAFENGRISSVENYQKGFIYNITL